MSSEVKGRTIGKSTGKMSKKSNLQWPFKDSERYKIRLVLCACALFEWTHCWNDLEQVYLLFWWQWVNFEDWKRWNWKSIHFHADIKTIWRWTLYLCHILSQPKINLAVVKCAIYHMQMYLSGFMCLTSPLPPLFSFLFCGTLILVSGNLSAITWTNKCETRPATNLLPLL